MNVATPENYRLGPGDEVIIDVWGASETTIRQTISPEGSILVNNLGTGLSEWQNCKGSQ